MAESEKPEKPSAEGPATAKKSKLSMLTLGLFGGAMVVEGVAIFMAMKFFGAEPDPTVGMTHTLQTTTAPFEESQEMEVAHVRVQNNNGTRTTLYNVRIAIRVRFDNGKKVTEFLKNRKDTIYDALNRVIRVAQEDQLQEPGLETLKRQVRFELSSLLKDDAIIEEVLFPEFTPLPTGF